MIRGRLRVISDNDYAGDPDGLFQLAHLLLSSSVETRGVIGSHLPPGDLADPTGQTATYARAAADRVIDLLGLMGRVATFEGSNMPLPNALTPLRSEAAEAIVTEAMRDDDRPLFVTLGGGLTELASAWLLEPRIADRLTAVWIGGPEYPGIAPAPPRPTGPDASEYNLQTDIAAAQVVFDSPIPLWQVPRDAYRQVLVGRAELEFRVAPLGRIGRHLCDAVAACSDSLYKSGMDLGETFVLGDSPLVLLTALQSSFDPDPSSSRYVELPAPAIDDHGRYLPRPDGRPIRVYTHLDTRLLLEDMVSKLALAAQLPATEHAG